MPSLVFHNGRFWAVTAHGVSSTDNHDHYRYWSGGRWLIEDEVIDLAVDSRGDSYALTESGISGIHFKSMTLQDKADYFHDKVRKRSEEHTSELQSRGHRVCRHLLEENSRLGEPVQDRVEEG